MMYGLWLSLLNAMGVLTAIHHEYYLNSSYEMNTVVKFQLTDQRFVMLCTQLFDVVFMLYVYICVFHSFHICLCL